MAFERYDGEIEKGAKGAITRAWFSRTDIGLLALLHEKNQRQLLHICYISSIQNEELVPMKYRGQIFMHVTPSGIKADGYRAVFNESGEFYGKGATDASVLGEFELEGLPKYIQYLYKKAAGFKGEIGRGKADK